MSEPAPMTPEDADIVPTPPPPPGAAENARAEVFFPASWNFEACLRWSRSRGFAPQDFLGCDTRHPKAAPPGQQLPSAGYIFYYAPRA